MQTRDLQLTASVSRRCCPQSPGDLPPRRSRQSTPTARYRKHAQRPMPCGHFDMSPGLQLPAPGKALLVVAGPASDKVQQCSQHRRRPDPNTIAGGRREVVRTNGGTHDVVTLGRISPSRIANGTTAFGRRTGSAIIRERRVRLLPLGEDGTPEIYAGAKIGLRPLQFAAASPRARPASRGDLIRVGAGNKLRDRRQQRQTMIGMPIRSDGIGGQT